MTNQINRNIQGGGAKLRYFPPGSSEDHPSLDKRTRKRRKNRKRKKSRKLRGGEEKCSKKVYLDWDLAAAPFSVSSRINNIEEEEALNDLITNFYKCTGVDNSDICPKKWDDDILIKYFAKLKNFLDNCPNVVILTANSESNVRKIMNRYFGNDYKQPYIISVSDDAMNGQKGYDIKKTEAISKRKKPFVFIDDSPTNINSMNAFIKREENQGRAILINRPTNKGRNAFSEYGMFNMKNVDEWIKDINSSTGGSKTRRSKTRRSKTRRSKTRRSKTRRSKTRRKKKRKKRKK